MRKKILVRVNVTEYLRITKITDDTAGMSSRKVQTKILKLTYNKTRCLFLTNLEIIKK